MILKEIDNYGAFEEGPVRTRVSGEFTISCCVNEVTSGSDI
jgi:hypothetical protein